MDWQRCYNTQSDKNGKKRNLTLRELRIRAEAGEEFAFTLAQAARLNPATPVDLSDLIRECQRLQY